MRRGDTLHGTLMDLRRRGSRVIFPGQLRVLLAAMKLWHGYRPVTLRAIGRITGATAISGTMNTLRRLRAAGHVRYKDSEIGTVVPAYEFIPAEAR